LREILRCAQDDKIDTMRIFLTGATGYVGGAVALALRERGHDVAALVRAESESKHLRDAGVVIVAGDLASLPSLGDAISGHDAYVHAAQSRTDTSQLDRTTLETFNAQNAAVVYTSGVWVLGNTTSADESTPVHPIDIVKWRPEVEELALSTGRGAVLRPGCVYGGKQSLFADWFAAADQNRPLRIVGDGENRWALIDLHDLAACFVRIVEERATGVFHAIDDTNATLNECARAVAPDGSIEHVPADAARGAMGDAFVEALLIDQRVSCAATRERLGWSPKRDFVRSVGEQWREWRSALQKSE